MYKILNAKAAIKREESEACFDFPECEQARPKVKCKMQNRLLPQWLLLAVAETPACCRKIACPLLKMSFFDTAWSHLKLELPFLLQRSGVFDTETAVFDTAKWRF
ncbi:MAG: hypothetical protein K5945_00340 [Bacteroidaceae bacterium]|nr:hypothetical protein [Bacteroidaceae bacterium]